MDSNEATKTSARRATITPSPFKRANGGKAPTGFGTWAFQATTTYTAFDADLFGEVKTFTGTLTQAIKALRAEGATGLWAVLS